MSQTRAYAAHAADQPLEPFNFERRQPRKDEVASEILYGIPVINFPIRGVQS